MQKIANKTPVQNRFQRLVCQAVNRETKSWTVLIWRLLLLVFVLVGSGGSLWHLYAGLFVSWQVRLATETRQNIGVLADQKPDSVSMTIPIDSFVREQDNPKGIERQIPH